jgi:FkbM family methyltransferase
MIRRIRKNSIVNGIVRNVIKSWGNKSSILYESLSNRWLTSGIIPCHFEGINFLMYNECDDGIVGFFFYEKQTYSEAQDLKIFLPLAKASNTVVDIGANTGLYSLLVGKVAPKTKVFAIEPYFVNYKRLTKNIFINGLDNIIPMKIAIGDESGSVEFNVPQKEMISEVASMVSSFPPSMFPELKWSKTSVEMMTLDEFAYKNQLKIDLIKCDVETYEMSVFKGAHEVLTTHRPAILFESFLDDERKVFFNHLLEQYDYHVYYLLKEGLVRLEKGFQPHKTGLNFLITPFRSEETFISHAELEENPKLLIG